MYYKIENKSLNNNYKGTGIELELTFYPVELKWNWRIIEGI